MGPANEPLSPWNSPLTTWMDERPTWFWSTTNVPWMLLVLPLLQLMTPDALPLPPSGHSPWTVAWKLNVPPVTPLSDSERHCPTSPSPVIWMVLVWNVRPGAALA